MRYGGRQWVTAEAREDVLDRIEEVAKKKVTAAILAAGLTPIGPVGLRWRPVATIKIEDPARVIPAWIRDEDWELRVWQRAEG